MPEEQKGYMDGLAQGAYERGYMDGAKKLSSAYFRIGHYTRFLEQIDTLLDDVIITEEVDIERIKKLQSAIREQLKQERLKQEINL